MWIVKDWILAKHKGMICAPESSFKTMLTSNLAVCVASGNDHLGQKVEKGPVLIVDEETPWESLDKHLRRFAQGSGYRDWRELPIEVKSFTGFRLGRNTELMKLLSTIAMLKPILIILDSMIAMAPGGRQGLCENDSSIGVVIRDDLHKILDTAGKASCLLTVHGKKRYSQIPIDELQKLDMQEMVRGHGSIVGQGCDTGYMLGKISEYPKRSLFAIVTKSRREGIPMSANIVYVELKEERYAEGWARLERISADSIPASDTARSMFPFFTDNKLYTEQQITRTRAFSTREECRQGVKELIDHKVVLPDGVATYRLNPRYLNEVNPDYLTSLN
jgi:hypothetical protein